MRLIFILQIQEHIFVEANALIKSIQVFMNALNELRLCYVIERATSASPKRESSKASMTMLLCFLLLGFAVYCRFLCLLMLFS